MTPRRPRHSLPLANRVPELDVTDKVEDSREDAQKDREYPYNKGRRLSASVVVPLDSLITERVGEVEEHDYEDGHARRCGHRDPGVRERMKDRESEEPSDAPECEHSSEYLEDEADEYERLSGPGLRAAALGSRGR